MPAFDFPNSPTVGQQITGPQGAVWQWDGVKWQAAPGAITQAMVVIGDQPPSNPAAGQLWYDSQGSNLYLWVPDGNSSQWAVAVAPPAPSASTSAGNTGRNLVHNGQFNVQQRGVGPWSASGNFTADRWQLARGTGGGTNSVGITAIGDGGRTAIGDEAAQFYLGSTFTGGSAAGDRDWIVQHIEKVSRTSGKTITVSFWAGATAGSPKIGINATQSFGTGGSPSAAVSALATGIAVTLTTNWARYSTVITLPSVAGKTFGTNGDDYLELTLCLSSGANNNAYSGNIGVQSATVYIWGVQLEIGSGYGFPTPLAKRDPADELALCQRFYQTGNLFSQQYSAAGTVVAWLQPYAVPMRAAPTVAASSLSYTNASGGGVTTWGGYGIQASCSVTAAGTTSMQGNFTASADL